MTWRVWVLLFLFRSAEKRCQKRSRLRVYREIMQKLLRRLSRANRLWSGRKTTTMTNSRVTLSVCFRFTVSQYFHLVRIVLFFALAYAEKYFSSNGVTKRWRKKSNNPFDIAPKRRINLSPIIRVGNTWRRTQ